MKALKTFAILFLAIVLASTSVLALSLDNAFVQIDEVKVNGVEANINIPMLLERGEDVTVEVFFTGSDAGKCESGEDNPCYDTRVEAEIEGFEFGDVRDVEGPFEVEPGVSYRKVLHLKIPEDMAASDDFDLNIEIKDDDDLVIARYPVRIQEQRHNLDVFDVIFNPFDNVQAGQPLFTTVRVENLGDNVESSIKVTVAIPSLGIRTSEFMDRLVTQEDQNDDDDEDEDESASTNDLLLMIPEDAREGDYDVVVTVDFNRGRTQSSKTFPMHIVKNVQTPAVEDTTGFVVSVDNLAQKVEDGKGAVYKFSVANLQDQAGIFTFETVGLQDWANYKIEPTQLLVQSDNTADAVLYIAPKEDVEGIKMFTVRVKSGNVVVAEKNLSLEVVEAQGLNAKTVFAWIFIVLLVILVILVIVVLIRRGSSREGTGIEGQTYY